MFNHNNVEYDFGGYATKNDIRCTDGRTIMAGAFKHFDGETVPLVWQHLHNSPENILGKAVLENREDGVYAFCKFNHTAAAETAKECVKNGEIHSLSIFASNVIEHSGLVTKGDIIEVSLVIAGANPGARIDNIAFDHQDGSMSTGSYYIISCDDPISLDDPGTISHAASGKSPTEIFNSFTPEQKDVVYQIVAEIASGNVEHSAEGGIMPHNVFESGQGAGSTITGAAPRRKTLTHSQIATIFSDAQKMGSFKQSFLQHAQEYGIENIEYLFPDHKALTPTPDMISRDMDWVQGVLNGVTKTGFSRIKSIAADITADEARAKGYIKGNRKKEEVFPLLKRVTGPTTFYKKQKLDRDDIIDIKDFDVVLWLWAEMRVMLNEELARAILVSDGREVDDEDKINEENIRPIFKDDDLYSVHITIPADMDPGDLPEFILRNKKKYKGSGSPKLYIEPSAGIDMLLVKDKIGRRIYETYTSLASVMGVSGIEEIPIFEETTRTDADGKTYQIVGIMVNLKDYKLGMDRGGEISRFEDFDIDYNQYKYLLEGRCSGTLTKPFSALVFEKDVTPTKPVTPPEETTSF